ncbi:coiled-coil domain-containing protein [Carnobacterium gallinarum]|uniref:coiled-coil domain-containing protein n=1 Tax=Carnobacterium gallinarum TaxID=2749 RepID=UPI00054D8CBE|nr:C40 family peptidase [Carnobacterium gallinarum]
MKKRLLTLVIAGTLSVTALASPLTVLADEYSDKIDAQNQKIKEIETQEQDVKTKLSGVTKEIVVAEEKARTLIEQSEATQKEMDKLTTQITDLNEKIESRTAQLEKQARAVQVSAGSEGYVDFILSAESLSDVVGRVDVVAQMVSANRELVKAQADDKASVEASKTKTEEKLADQRKVTGELEKLKGELEGKKLEQESAVATLAASKTTAEGERDTFIAKKDEADKKAAALAAATLAAKTPPPAPVQTDAPKNVPNNAGTDTPAIQMPSTSGTVTAAEGQAIVAEAANYLGTPYVWAGKSPGGFDCSGFTGYVYSRVLGKSIGGFTVPQESSGVEVPMSALQAGDLLFWGARGSTHHVAIYVGGGTYIHAPQTGDVVKYQSLSGYAPSFAIRVVK